MKLFAVIIPFAVAVMAISSEHQQCESIETRVEWRALSQEQRDSYHKAVRCLQTKPSDIEGKSLFDRFASNHVDMFDKIHYVAAFLPWHRYFSLARAGVMKDCKYNGPTPYWDWTKDVKKMNQSEIFDPIKGFGGDGRPTDNCVANGPYSSQSNFTIGPEKRCLKRKFNMDPRGPVWAPTTGPSDRHSQAVIDKTSQNSKFTDFWPALESTPHDWVHNEISGDMAATFSPNDALFFMHHNNIDRIWALWQGRNATRLQDYGGNTIQGQSFVDPRYPLATLNDTIDIGIQGYPPVQVYELMDTLGPKLCYKTHWNEYVIKLVEEKGDDSPSMMPYIYSKTVAEKAAWKWWAENEKTVDWDLATINPPYMVGAPIHSVTSRDQLTSTNGVLSAIATPHENLSERPLAIAHVRDVAIIHSALFEKQGSVSGRRVFVAGSQPSWQDLYDALSGFSGVPKGNPGVGTTTDVGSPDWDTTFARELLGREFTGTKETIVETEEYYRQKGWSFFV
ncbi:unnamed protein product [Rhizoctonia solani]|uniref:Tyrosinase copper-binding domain-containing protein n=1 Tax=Rhizoctonia solani TaxID=456999 RepID=A0A8H3DZ25_9AGAM|nr:unnamed protein product [Rhizoctonia solani]